MIFVDSDIILDTILQRYPYSTFSDRLLSLNLIKEIAIGTSSHCLLNVYYHARKNFGKEKAVSAIKEMIDNLTIFSVDSSHLEAASISQINDFEDAVEYEIAISNSCRSIITRNLRDYKKSQLPVYTAEQYLNIL